MQYVHFLMEEASIAPCPPIDLGRIYDRFGIKPKYSPLPDNQQGLLVNPERGLVLINEDDPATRQRFSEAHELIEYLFSCLPSGGGWASRRAGPFKQTTKERLCQAGAAELLMPRDSFLPRLLAAGVSYQTARQLADEFRVSAMAALIQMVQLGPGLHGIVLWRMKNKPTEIRRRTPPNQRSLFNDAPRVVDPPPKLRVEWSWNGPRAPYIPPHKSAPDECSIYQAWRDGTFTIGEDNLDLGRIRGVCRCENKPVQIEGQRQVLSLLHLPGDIGCRTAASPSEVC